VCVNAKAYPGADIDSDHKPVVIKLRVKLKKVVKAFIFHFIIKMKDEGLAMNQRCETDTAVVAEKQKVQIHCY